MTRVPLVISALLLAIGALAVSPAPSSAAMIVVTRTDDPAPNECEPGDCSLREAIIKANLDDGPDVISVPVSVTLSRPGTGENAAQTGDLDITEAVTITGAGQNATVIDADQVDKVFHVLTDVGPVLIELVTVTGGFSGENGGDGAGLINNGTLVLRHVTVRDNATTFNDGGGIDNGGALTIESSVVRDNSADSAGGGISNSGDLTIIDSLITGNDAEVGGGVDTFRGDVEIRRTTISDNAALNGNALDFGGGGGILAGIDGTLSIIESAVLNNTSEANGGGIRVTAGGQVTTVNSTFSGNEANKGAGVYLSEGASVGLLNSTVAFNSAAKDGGGIFPESEGVSLTNTIVANNEALNGPDCEGALFTLGGNLLGDSDGCSLLPPPGIQGGLPDLTPDITNADPGLLPIGNYGGLTATHAAPETAAIVESGDDEACPERDQRGVRRPQGEHCDIGAFEFNFVGNVDCEGSVTESDLLALLANAAAVDLAPCIEVGDVTCDTFVDVVDALHVARHLADLPLQRDAACPAIGPNA